MNEAFSKWADEMTAIGTERGAMWTAWRACEEHYAEELASLRAIASLWAEEQEKEHHVPKEPKLTREGVLALADSEEGLERLRELVAGEVMGWSLFKYGEKKCYWQDAEGCAIVNYPFKPDVNPTHNWQVIETMREKGWHRRIDVVRHDVPEYSTVRFVGSKHPTWDVCFTDDEMLKTCLATLLAVRGL